MLIRKESLDSRSAFHDIIMNLIANFSLLCLFLLSILLDKPLILLAILPGLKPNAVTFLYLSKRNTAHLSLMALPFLLIDLLKFLSHPFLLLFVLAQLRNPKSTIWLSCACSVLTCFNRSIVE